MSRNEFLLNVIVPYELSEFLVVLKKTELKTIINISSMYGVIAVNPNLYTEGELGTPLNYSVCKAGLNHLTKELAIKYTSKNINVYSIAYGGVEGNVSDDFKNRYEKLCPSGKMLSRMDVVSPIESILLGHLSGMTGETIAINGGWNLW